MWPNESYSQWSKLNLGKRQKQNSDSIKTHISAPPIRFSVRESLNATQVFAQFSPTIWAKINSHVMRILQTQKGQ